MEELEKEAEFFKNILKQYWLIDCDLEILRIINNNPYINCYLEIAIKEE